MGGDFPAEDSLSAFAFFDMRDEFGDAPAEDPSDDQDIALGIGGCGMRAVGQVMLAVPSPERAVGRKRAAHWFRRGLDRKSRLVLCHVDEGQDVFHGDIAFDRMRR